MLNPIFALLAVALAVGRKPTTWLIDGNNVLGQRGTPRDASILTERLKPMSESGDDLVLIFDGQSGQTSRDEEGGGGFRNVKLEEGTSADDFILEEIQRISQDSKLNRVKVVTADKRLRRAALVTRPTVKIVVNPKTFWKKYRPRMAGLKKKEDESSQESEEATP